MSNQLVHYQPGELTQADIQTVRETIAKDCNEPQFKLFMAIAKASGANPIMNEIYPTVRQGQLTVQFGIDFFVRKAKESEGYEGYDVQLVHENDKFKMHQERAEDGRYYAVIDEHSWGFPRGKVIGGYAIAYRKGHKPFTVVMEVDEVEHFKKSNIGMQKTMWTNYFNDMFKKHMVRRALKAAYNLNFDDEHVVGESSSVPEYKPKDITPVQEILPSESESKEDRQVNQEQELSEEERVRKQMMDKFAQLGITDKKEMAEYIKLHAKPKGDKPSLQEMIGLLHIMDMHIETKQTENDELPM